MMETMLSKIELNFNALEKEIYRIGCEFASSLMEQVLQRMDEHLEKHGIRNSCGTKERIEPR